MMRMDDSPPRHNIRDSHVPVSAHFAHAKSSIRQCFVVITFSPTNFFGSRHWHYYKTRWLVLACLYRDTTDENLLLGHFANSGALLRHKLMQYYNLEMGEAKSPAISG